MPTGTRNQIIRSFSLNNVTTFNAFGPNPYIIANQVGSSQKDKELYKSSLGTPVFTDLTLDRIRYEEDGITKIVPEIRLDTVLVSVSMTKNIVETAIQGRNGTVPEYIGMGDYQITINGILCGENGQYPRDEVAALKKKLDAPVSIPVVSWYLQNLDIYDVIVKDWSMDQDPGGYSKQNFTINCRSYFPTILLIS